LYLGSNEERIRSKGQPFKNNTASPLTPLTPLT
jgi:hypothetical protein